MEINVSVTTFGSDRLWVVAEVYSTGVILYFKGRVQSFSMQVVMNKCFLRPKKTLAQIRLAVFEKNAKTAHFNSEKGRYRAKG